MGEGKVAGSGFDFTGHAAYPLGKLLREVAMRYGCIAMSLLCAWVLWKEQSFLREATPTTHRIAILGSAYATLQDCDATLQQYMREALAKGNTLANPQVLEWRSTDGKLTIIAGFHCLPDTVDPRAPKAVK